MIENCPSPHPSPLRGEGKGEGALMRRGEALHEID
jgi:hypothetical protein